MSSTNKTISYDLSQYTANDKPTYLGDYNGDMGKIDAGIHDVDVKAGANTTAIGTLTDLETQAKNTLVSAINEVNSNTEDNTTAIGTNTLAIANNTTHIGDMTDLETTSKDALVNAINELKRAINNFNLTSFLPITSSSISSTEGTVGASSSVTVAKNSDGSLAKVYGQIIVSNVTNNPIITIANSGLTPESDITINNAGIMRIAGSNNQFTPTSFDITIKTNGNIEINKLTGASGQIVFWLLPYLYFVKDFGDSPLPN